MAFSSPELKEVFQHLDFPDYFRTELGIAKGLASIALCLPFRLAKEAAYVGLSISFVSKFMAHVVVGDPRLNIVYPLVVLALLIVLYLTHRKSVSLNDCLSGYFILKSAKNCQTQRGLSFVGFFNCRTLWLLTICR